MRINTEMFTHDKVGKTFTAEASDLPHGWMDGITLVSPRKTTAAFFLKEVVREVCEHETGDIQEWVFTCSTNPRVADYKVIIFND